MHTTTLESLVAHPKARIAAGVVWLVGALGSGGLLMAAKAPIETPTMKMASSLPAAPLDIPLLRSLPQPQPMKKAPRTLVSRR